MGLSAQKKQPFVKDTENRGRALSMKTVYLLTGKPGTGKTSLIKQTLAAFKGKAGGFYTEEIRKQGTRLGFKLVTLANSVFNKVLKFGRGY